MINIEIKNVTKTIHKQTVIREVSASMESGKIYGFQGINGSGKTMLMRLISGLIRPTEGSIEINGKVLGRDITFPESIGLFLEKPAFLGSYSGFQNLKMLASIQNRIDDTRIRDTLSAVGLDPDDGKKYRKYSLGMKQRLGLAGALLGRPPILILDEPTNGLDPSGIHEIRNLIQSLPSYYDCTILISSHMLSEIELMADDIGILNYGNLLFEGSLDELRQKAVQTVAQKTMQNTAYNAAQTVGAVPYEVDTVNLEDIFLSMIEQDNENRKQRAVL